MPEPNLMAEQELSVQELSSGKAKRKGAGVPVPPAPKRLSVLGYFGTLTFKICPIPTGGGPKPQLET